MKKIISVENSFDIIIGIIVFIGFLAVLETFDVPSVAPNCTKRSDSNVAPQALLLMNSDFIVKYSQLFAAHVLQNGGATVKEKIAYAWQRAFGQKVSEELLGELAEFLALQQQELQQGDSNLKVEDAKTTAFEMLCQALFASNQFIYVD